MLGVWVGEAARRGLISGSLQRPPRPPALQHPPICTIIPTTTTTTSLQRPPRPLWQPTNLYYRASLQPTYCCCCCPCRVVCFVIVESTWRPLKQPLYQLTNRSVLFLLLLLLLLLYLLLTMSIDLYALLGNTRPGLFSSSLRIRNWTYRTSCKGRPGPHAVAVQALRTSSANQLHYALPCEKLRGILCSCPLNTDRILALKNTLKGARLIGGFG